MGKYLTTTDYMYVICKIKKGLFHYGFYCPQENNIRTINSHMCPCLTKKYLQSIGETIIDILNEKDGYKYSGNTEASLNKFICVKNEKYIDFSLKPYLVSLYDFSSNSQIDLLLKYCVSMEKQNVKDENIKTKLIKIFYDFFAKNKAYTDFKILVGNALQEHYHNLNTNCGIEERRDSVVRCLYNFYSKYKNGKNNKKYCDLFRFLIDLLSELEFDNDIKCICIFEEIESFLNDTTDNNIYVFDENEQ